MQIDHLVRLFQQARELTGHSDYVVIGSLSILGVEEDGPIPADMSMSIDIDCYTLNDPGRVFDLQGALGEASAFRAEHGYFLDPVSPNLPSLPAGWEGRMNQVERDGLRICFLHPDDAAISKYARGDARDLRWLRSGIQAGLISLPTVRSRMRSTTFLDAEEEQRVRTLVAADSAWFETVKVARVVSPGRGAGST